MIKVEYMDDADDACADAVSGYQTTQKSVKVKNTTGWKSDDNDKIGRTLLEGVAAPLIDPLIATPLDLRTPTSPVLRPHPFMLFVPSS